MSLGIERRIELEMRGREKHQILDLNLDNCRATKIEGLSSDFSNLQTLSLINLGLQTLENFPKLGNLRKLELSDNKILGGLEHLTGCPNLTYLSLSGNNIKDVDTLDPLKDLAHLTSLDLFHCEVTNNPDYREKVFEKLKQIVYLDGFDREEKEQEDGEDDDEDDEDEINDEDDDDDNEDEDEVGLSYLTKNIDDDDDDDEEDFEPIDGDDDDEVVEAGDDDDDDDDDEIVESGDDDDDDEDEEGAVDGSGFNEEEDDEDEDEEGEEARGTKRKHEEEEEGDDDEEEEA